MDLKIILFCPNCKFKIQTRIDSDDPITDTSDLLEACEYTAAIISECYREKDDLWSAYSHLIRAITKAKADLISSYEEAHKNDPQFKALKGNL